MGYPNHVKKTPHGLRYRVWSTITDSYISDEMTETELREFELVRQTRRAVENIWQDMDRQIANSENVHKWEKERREKPMSGEASEKLSKRLYQMIGAEVKVNSETQADGAKILTIRITPVPKLDK